MERFVRMLGGLSNPMETKITNVIILKHHSIKELGRSSIILLPGILVLPYYCVHYTQIISLDNDLFIMFLSMIPKNSVSLFRIF